MIAVTSIVVAVVIYTTDSSEQATIAGAFLALLGVLITQGVNTMIAWTTARDNQERSLALEEQRFQADTFKQYFEYVSRLIADDLLDSGRLMADELTTPERQRDPTDSTPPSFQLSPNQFPLLIVLRARTLAVLPGQNPQRKANVLEFLYETGLIYKLDGAPALSLASADLSGVDLSGSVWENLDLSWTDLHGATFTETVLHGADLSGADLSGADLTNADLTGAIGITNETLEQEVASLAGATMPNGQKYEEWLKTKAARGESLNDDQKRLLQEYEGQL